MATHYYNLNHSLVPEDTAKLCTVQDYLSMKFSGNGLRKNPHLCRIFERTFGAELILSDNDEEAACGAAIYAAKHHS